MDPYQTLGISRSCTREEVKDVFRIRAWHAHPDRGGETEAFIRLCTAYKQILDELDRRPGPRLPERPRTPRPGRPSVPPVPDGIPDLIFLDEVAPVRRPPKPTDPNWKPDLIVLDEASPVTRSPKPADPRIARKTYRSRVHQAVFASARGRSVRGSDGAGTLGALIILAVIIGSLLACWMAWEYAARQSEQAAPRLY